MSQFSSALAEVQATEQDFEWYPTTKEIITEFYCHVKKYSIHSLLDVGAGNGKVLLTFEELLKSENDRGYIKLFAVEKSKVLLDSMNIEIGIMGTDFWEQSFLDKKVDCIFSNPPYSEFVNWSAKLIREANAQLIYLVVPQRWKEQTLMLKAIEDRQATCTVIGEFDFLESEDRKARAKVELLCIQLYTPNAYDYSERNREVKVNSFELWVKDHFGLNADAPQDHKFEYDKERKQSESRKEKISTALVGGGGLIDTLYQLYTDELAFLLENYKKVCQLDVALFKELNISVSSIVSNIESRVKGLKDAYWTELFDNYEPITKRLTKKSREDFIRTIRAATNIDFTPSNAYAVTAWSIKHANGFYDQQMIHVFDEMVSFANIANYKSNQKVFEQNSYRYYKVEETHFKLEYRIVLERSGGLNKSTYASEARSGLSNSAADFLDDILVVAANLGFERADSVFNHRFNGSEKHEFTCKEKNTIGLEMVLFDVRAFLNGNMHVRFDQNFMLALNVEVGRLKGWIHNAQQAAEELNEDVREVAKYFKKNYTVLPNAIDQLLLSKQ